MLLQSLPFRDAERLHVLQMLYPDGTTYSSLSAPDFMSVRAEQRVFEQVEAMDTPLLTLLGAGEPREVNGAFVSDGMFDDARRHRWRWAAASCRRSTSRIAAASRCSTTVSGSACSAAIPACSAASITTGGIAYTIVGVTRAGLVAARAGRL